MYIYIYMYVQYIFTGLYHIPRTQMTHIFQDSTHEIEPVNAQKSPGMIPASPGMTCLSKHRLTGEGEQTHDPMPWRGWSWRT